MSELQRFLPADQELLVGLFYRVGMWMSAIDDTDEETASEEKEEAKLRQVLQSLANNKKSVLVAEIASESLRQTGNRQRWSGELDNVLDDVAAAKRVLKGQGLPIEIIAFSKALMLIATVVAQAFREESELSEAKGYIGWIAEKANELTLALKDRDAHKDMSISPAEDTALNDLFETLKA